MAYLALETSRRPDCTTHNIPSSLHEEYTLPVDQTYKVASPLSGSLYTRIGDATPGFKQGGFTHQVAWGTW